MRKKLAIMGHSTRGEEVIELLEMMGGVNVHNLYGEENYAYYVIEGVDNEIRGGIYIYGDEDLHIFTLDEFYEKYPFKVGDKVIDKADGCPGVVSEMKWDEDVSDMKYCVAFGNGIDFGWFANDSIDFCKENENLEGTKSNQDIDKDVFRKEFCECCGSQRCSGQDDELEDCERFKNLMDNSGKPSDKNHKMDPKSKLPPKYYEDRIEEIKSKREYDELRTPLDDDENNFPPFEPMFKMNDELEYMVPDGYEITEASKDKVFIKPIKSKYPKTLGDCCKVILDIGDYQMCGYKHELLFNFQNLLICRDAYWKIAGEQMGLGKPWEPDWKNTKNVKYGIALYNDTITKMYLRNENVILVFPTEEMLDAFYVNFKDLIEKCKELL